MPQEKADLIGCAGPDHAKKTAQSSTQLDGAQGKDQSSADNRSKGIGSTALSRTKADTESAAFSRARADFELEMRRRASYAKAVATTTVAVSALLNPAALLLLLPVAAFGARAGHVSHQQEQRGRDSSTSTCENCGDIVHSRALKEHVHSRRCTTRIWPSTSERSDEKRTAVASPPTKALNDNLKVPIAAGPGFEIRHNAGAIEGSDVNAAVTNVVTGATNEHVGQKEVSASSLTSAKSARSIDTSAQMESLRASMDLQRPKFNKVASSITQTSPIQLDATVTSNRIDDLLRSIQSWTESTGDAHVLRWLLRNVRDLNANVRAVPGGPRGEDIPGHSPNSASLCGDAHNSSGFLPKCSSNNDRDSNKRKDSHDQGRLKLMIAHGTHTKRARLRCPLFFGEEEHRCHAAHKYIRDLM